MLVLCNWQPYDRFDLLFLWRFSPFRAPGFFLFKECDSAYGSKVWLFPTLHGITIRSWCCILWLLPHPFGAFFLGSSGFSSVGFLRTITAPQFSFFLFFPVVLKQCSHWLSQASFPFFPLLNFPMCSPSSFKFPVSLSFIGFMHPPLSNFPHLLLWSFACRSPPRHGVGLPGMAPFPSLSLSIFNPSSPPLIP